jgi:HEPN domain-containing protein
MSPGKPNPLLDKLALQSFRDVADADYIAARMAFRARLFLQALWGSQQALEKYIKAILLLRRIKYTKAEHKLKPLLMILEDQFPLKLTEETRRFIALIDAWDVDRYFMYSYGAARSDIAFLDLAVWDIRRYCAIYRPGEATKNGITYDQIDLDHIESADGNLPQKYRPLFPGYLETVMKQKSEAKSALIWNNFYFGRRIRRSNRNFSDTFYSANSVIANHPEILLELEKYIFLPRELRSPKSVAAKPK